MKTVAAIVAVVAFAAIAQAENNCPFEELVKLDQIINVPTTAQCSFDAQFSFFPPSRVPTLDDLANMCASPACVTTITALKALEPADCVTNFFNGVEMNVKAVIGEFDALCTPSRNLRQ